MELMIGLTKCVKKNLLGVTIRIFTDQTMHYTRLAEVGRLETPKIQGKYDTGQLFLHRVFGYRGVVLFPWLARVYDRDIPNKRDSEYVKSIPYNRFHVRQIIFVYLRLKEFQNCMSLRMCMRMGMHVHTCVNPYTKCPDDANYNHVGKEVKGRTHTFYQVLIDSRDCPYIVEAVTFLGNQDSSRSLYAIPGLDYVAHEDIFPYTTTEKQPLQHELFDKFLMYYPDKDPPFGAQETLRAWQKKNHPWLELSDVHKETTENVRVTVIPFYMGCRESQATSVFWWRYCIRLENLGDLTVQLRERHWRIFSLSGTLETVRGRGVVGQEPVLSSSLPAFQYSSHVSLQAPSGHMWGTFRMEREDGYTFDCRIPPFSLESKSEDPGATAGVI
ncbi:polymerase delta-interacting protein 2 [Cryptotermes secundus]|uniref:Polymerase delta-interacting protein 2 n=1 Tax=Cryptotermes secundus TaxID=105785 RepID=A0A2J7RI27_9NEOP|nr:polymerase delta-interacting protein 2 [Cryptotermes secundus]